MIYILLEDGTFLMVAPRIFYGNNFESYKDNYCTLVGFKKFDKKFTIKTHMEILRKDLKEQELKRKG